MITALTAYAWEAHDKRGKKIATIRDEVLNAGLSKKYGWDTSTPVYEIDSKQGAFYLRYNWNLDAWQVGTHENFLI